MKKTEIKGILLKVIKHPDHTIYIGDISLIKNDGSFYDELYHEMSEFRKNKCDKLKNVSDRARCIGAGALLNEAMKEQGISEREISYVIGKNGKPSIAGHPEIFFNLSHSHDRVMCVTAGFSVGCDVEIIKPYNGFQKRIAERFFSENEKEYLKKLENLADDGFPADMFYKIWTLKESFIKCTGEGLSHSFENFSVIDDFGNPVLTEIGNMLDSRHEEDKIRLISFKDDGYWFGVALALK